MMLQLSVPDPYLCALCERVVRGPADPGHDFQRHVDAAASRASRASRAS